MAAEFYVKHGLAGYGPDLDSEDEPCSSLPEAVDWARDELERDIDQLIEVANVYAEEGRYEEAWNSYKLSERLDILRMNIDPKRASAPLYEGNSDLWNATLERIVEESFPVDVDIQGNERLYLWEVS